MIKRSLSRKYFLVCFLSIITSVLILALLMFAIATQFFEQDKYSMIRRNANVAAALTASDYATGEEGTIELRNIATPYTLLSSTIEADFMLVDMEGRLIYRSTDPEQIALPVEIPQEIMVKAAKGNYQNTGVFPGIYQEPHYIVGVPVLYDGQPVAVLFAAASANSLVEFLRRMAKMFVIATLIVLVVAGLLVSYLTSRMVKPLRQMLDATNSFSKGDFSKRVPVSGYDKVGQLAMAFNNMASALAANEKTSRSFIANVSHELRTPMTTIGGYVDGLLDGTIPDEKRNQYLQVVSQEVKRLTRLVRSMLDTARIEAGEMHTNPTVFDISEVIRQTVFTFEARIEEKRLEIRGLEEDRVMVLADKDLMHQVVYNLLENAVKFVNEDGYLQVSYRTEGTMTHVIIRNSGEGISKIDTDQIFERFYKSDRSHTSPSTGVGLGLHIVRTIIHHHGGTIEARSTEGEYAEFDFTIPTASKQQGGK
ncbi:MAG: sensor histidine kinase [Oscillospiraceae bacterium]